MRFLKVTLPLSLALITGLLGIAVCFISHVHAQNLLNEYAKWGRVIGGVTVFIGVYSILRMHAIRVLRQHGGWAYSATLYVAFVLVVGLGAYNLGAGPLKPRNAQLNDGVQWLYDSIASPAGATIFSTLGFFICSAAYRTFRAKTLEAGVLLVAALIVMFGQVPLSVLVWEKIPRISGWLLETPNMAVKRAILFGICLGSVATSLRVIFGIERSYMGGDK